jgi:hypothetical protein
MDKKIASKVHFALDAAPSRDGIKRPYVHQLGMDAIQEAFSSEVSFRDLLRKVGISVPNSVARDMMNAYAMDSVQGPVTTPSVPGLIQFLQNWLPGQVFTMTAAREIDNLIGINTQGEFSDAEIVQAVLAMTGYPRPYTDDGNSPLASWNQTYVPRTNVRFEMGMRVGVLEEETSARVRVNSAQTKRESCGEQLEITRNLVGFYGYNSGANNTYGFLNDPGLLPIVTAANGATGHTEWSTKTMLEIIQDLLNMFVQLRTQSLGRIDPKKMATVLAVPTNAIDYLSTPSDLGYSVLKWLKDNYPLVRVQDAIQLENGAVGNGLVYLYPERIADLSTDDGKVWIQVVPMKFRVLGVQKLTKAWQEDYANATAGAMCKRPWAVTVLEGVS